MDWKYLLFSFEGRINRKPYWLASIALGLLGASLIVGLTFLTAAAAEGQLALSPQIAVALLLAVIAAMLFCSLAISVKRLHDRNKSGWWMALYYGVGGAQEAANRAGLSGTEENPTEIGIALALAGLAVGIWYLIDLGILKGTPGPNRFGPDPLGGAPRPADASM
jgi:uncharacterized membrane protein YhaH (DUF805 family)